ncbi:MAG: hypothetical protein GXY86_03115 [Firmicutes bacterium]|nr:hypothetical protein [Bacillota bacterium]
MAYSEAAKNATRRYITKTYDRLELQLKKGTKKIYRKHANKQDMSLNAYIISLIEKDMEEKK